MSDHEPTTPERRSRRRTWQGLGGAAALLVVIAVVAQVAGVGVVRSNSKGHAAVRTKPLVKLPGAPVPDITSTLLGSTRTSAAKGQTVRMHGIADVSVVRLASKASTTLVCGITYSRAGDPSWTLGTPYRTVSATHRGALRTITIARTFRAPAKDVYSMAMRCHVADPTGRSAARASGSIRASLGQPKGSVPVVRN